MKNQSLAKKCLALFENSERPDGSKYVCFTTQAIEEKTPEYQALSELVFDSDVDSDSAYSWTVDCLRDIAERSDTDDVCEVASQYADENTPVYNGELCEWLSKGNWWLVDEAIAELGDLRDGNRDGGIMDLIIRGYYYALDHHYHRVYEMLEGLE